MKARGCESTISDLWCPILKHIGNGSLRENTRHPVGKAVVRVVLYARSCRDANNNGGAATIAANRYELSNALLRALTFAKTSVLSVQTALSEYRAAWKNCYRASLHALPVFSKKPHLAHPVGYSRSLDRYRMPRLRITPSHR